MTITAQGHSSEKLLALEHKAPRAASEDELPSVLAKWLPHYTAPTAMFVDAKNERAEAFYERYGFRAFASTPRRLFMPLETFEKPGL